MFQFDVFFHFITSVSLRDSRWHSFLAVYSRRCDTISPLWQPLKMDLHPDSTDLNMSTWPYQSILQAFYLMDYPNAAMTTWSSTGNRFTSCQSLQPHNWNYWRWTSWKKPSRSFVGNASRLAFWRGTSRCGFKLLHTTLQNSPMDILAPSTMTWPGRKSLTITGSHMITDTFTFELSLPTTHKSDQDDDFNLVQLQELLLLSDLPPFQTHCSKEKELGPCIDIAGAKLSTPKKTLLWLLFCVVSADFPFTFWRSFRAPIFPTSTLTPWRSKEQFRTFYFYAEPPRSHTVDSLSVDQPCYQHYARQLSDKTQQSSSRFQCTTTAHIGTDSHSSNDRKSEIQILGTHCQGLLLRPAGVYEQPTKQTSTQKYTGFPRGFPPITFWPAHSHWPIFGEQCRQLQSCSPHLAPHGQCIHWRRRPTLTICTPRTTSQISADRKISSYRTHWMAMAPTSRIFAETTHRPRCSSSFLSHHVVEPVLQSKDLRPERCSKKTMLISLR